MFEEQLSDEELRGAWKIITRIKKGDISVDQVLEELRGHDEINVDDAVYDEMGDAFIDAVLGTPSQTPRRHRRIVGMKAAAEVLLAERGTGDQLPKLNDETLAEIKCAIEGEHAVASHRVATGLELLIEWYEKWQAAR